jgi:hypothetical protein
MNTKIENLINDVGCVIRNGMNKLMYDFTVQHLTNELEKCKSEMEYYKNELEKIKKEYSSNKENIVLEIHDDISNKSGVTKTTIDNFFCLNSQNIVVSKNEEEEETVAGLEEEPDTGLEEEEVDEEEEEETVASLEEEEETVAGLEEEEVEEEEETVASLEEEEETVEEEEHRRTHGNKTYFMIDTHIQFFK